MNSEENITDKKLDNYSKFVRVVLKFKIAYILLRLSFALYFSLIFYRNQHFFEINKEKKVYWMAKTIFYILIL